MSGQVRIPDEDLAVPSLPLGRYKHYKGNLYDVIGVGLDSESNEPVVIYSPAGVSQVPYWVRPFAMFVETVTVDGQSVSRFEYLGEQ